MVISCKVLKKQPSYLSINLETQLGVTRARADVYRMHMITVRSVGTHLPTDHLAVTE